MEDHGRFEWKHFEAVGSFWFKFFESFPRLRIWTMRSSWTIFAPKQRSWKLKQRRRRDPGWAEKTVGTYHSKEGHYRTHSSFDLRSAQNNTNKFAPTRTFDHHLSSQGKSPPRNKMYIHVYLYLCRYLEIRNPSTNPARSNFRLHRTCLDCLGMCII